MQENKDEIEDIITDLAKKYPNYLFISPVHTFGFLYNSVDYKTGISYCLWLLEKCDEIWVFGEWQNSLGCKMEVDYCEKFNIPYKIIDYKNEKRVI